MCICFDVVLYLLIVIDLIATLSSMEINVTIFAFGNSLLSDCWLCR